MIKSIDEEISFSKRHPGKTIRQILQYDSGYLKDLFLKTSLVFSPECFDEIKRLTKGHKDNWESPANDTKTKTVFQRIKSYGTPYLYDFNEKFNEIDLEALNTERLKVEL